MPNMRRLEFQPRKSIELNAGGHLIWFGRDADRMQQQRTAFLREHLAARLSGRPKLAVRRMKTDLPGCPRTSADERPRPR